MSVEVILTDIEGTTSPIAFVKQTLFPLAHRRLPDFIDAHGEEPEVRSLLEDAAREGGLPDEASDAQIVALLRRWIEEDRKITPLKALQGRIWAGAWASGEVQSPVYEDAVRSLRRWHEAGHRLAVYSSGSVGAQKRFFGYSDHGDLTGLFSAWFDTTTGGKKEPSSYARIAEALGVAPQDVLFLSDVPEELDAAREVGMQTTWLVRPEDVGEAPPDAAHPVARTFDDIECQAPAGRRPHP